MDLQNFRIDEKDSWLLYGHFYDLVSQDFIYIPNQILQLPRLVFKIFYLFIQVGWDFKSS